VNYTLIVRINLTSLTGRPINTI